MDNSLLLSIIIAVIITLFFSLWPMNNNHNDHNNQIRQQNTKEKHIEEMSSEEIITDFNLLFNKENFGNKLYNNNNQNNNKNNNKNNNPTGRNYYDEGKSSWDMYTQAPYYFIKTHPNKPVFYEKTIYRKPYNFPVTYESSYPINYFKLFEN
jgi:FtsZ-interacting cell division protein ZipA